MTENSPNLPRRLTTTTVIVTHVLNVVSKAILNLSVLSTFRKHGDEKKGKKDRKEKKTYIACEDSASTTSNSSSDEEIANTCLMIQNPYNTYGLAICMHYTDCQSV